MAMTFGGIALTLTVVTTGLSAGALAVFGYAVLPGLNRAGPQVAVPAMQRMNVAILNPLFMVIFFGGLVLGLVSLWVYWGSSLRWWLLAAVALTAAGIAITMAINVPANDRLAAAGDVTTATAAWADFTAIWVRWNTVRAVLTVTSFAVLVAGLIWSRD